MESKSLPLNIQTFDTINKPDDLYLIGDSLIDEKGLNGHHLESANNFYKNGIKQIITKGFKIERHIHNKRSATEEDKKIERIHAEVIPTDVKLSPPTTFHYSTSKESVLFPNQALSTQQYYSGTLTFSCDVRAIAYLHDGTTLTREDKVKDFRICKVPIIKGSIMCNTYGKTKHALMQLGEDPTDPGGYFVVGGEWAVSCTENITFNQPKIYINEGYGKSRVRCEFISKPGDHYQNSDMLIIRFFKDDTLTIEIARDKLSKVQIPFYMLFRAMGWSNDKELIDWIVLDTDAEENQPLYKVLIDALNAKYVKKDTFYRHSKEENNHNSYKTIYNQTEVLQHVVDLVPFESYQYLELGKNPDNYSNAINDVLRVFDVHCLPHIGMTSASRHEKLKFIALLVRKTLLVYLRHIPQTDRDSYRNKRIHAAGENYAKAFKTFFNQTVVMPIKRRMMKDFNGNSFSQVNLANIVKVIYAEEFERLIVQTIISGNKSSLKIKRKNITNRLASQQLHRKNQLNVMATMRQISATGSESAKQSERANEMRRVHMSSLGYICPVHSPPEGEKVGINKQMSIFAFISPTGSSEVLKKKVLEDPDLIPASALKPKEIFQSGFARVLVNGHLLGYADDSVGFAQKYRHLRRKLLINPYTTVYWDNVQNEINMFVDMGRISRPLMIVYNNQRDPEKFDKKFLNKNKSKFVQGIAVTNDDIKALYAKKKTLNDLVLEQKVEFITPEEQENCYVCANYQRLQRDTDNELLEYTHCDIPQAILGITALTAPFGNHNPTARVTYQTTQAKQTCGHYAMNWPFRMDKEVFLQYTNETPLAYTAGNKYLHPNGNNVMVAIACYTGLN